MCSSLGPSQSVNSSELMQIYFQILWIIWEAKGTAFYLHMDSVGNDIIDLIGNVAIIRRSGAAIQQGGSVLS